ncbi:L-rhamnose mutarotase [Niabella hibiscisoli]|uniref:L-rhamnose mutarotase n=1 Tax=Niabella hibiscisoli TaxID=1825928 RepID=UPI001F0E433E|nr:L-rhamnose mutarotase [Niabella hibiscisoli]MCH5719604.1 right-handed parallel beta-helix repeat-containing protein [Niabella hibiscisoli]
MVAGAQVYVAPNGSDANAGSKEKPKASLQSALRQVREFRRLNDTITEGPIQVILQEGIYWLQEPVVIRAEDAGTPQSPTSIEAAPGAKVVLSGGVVIKGWKKAGGIITNLPAVAQSKVWEAPLPEAFDELPGFRQLWVNNTKATRAKWPNGGEMERIISWNKKDESCQIPKPPVPVKDISGLEMFIHQWWEIATLRVKQMNVAGDSAQLLFRQPESRIQSEHPWPAPWISKETGNSAFYLSNAIEFLDEPGEWYIDRMNKKIYYWPRTGEDLATAHIIAPLLENLVTIQGTIDEPVSHIQFKNIAFEHVGWNRPSLQGHVPHQAGMPMTEAYKLRPSGTPEKASLDNQAWITRPGAAVTASFVHNLSVEGCRFEHMASTGLDYHLGVKNSKVIGNLFKDIGGTAILAGSFADEGMEIHLPYNPTDERVVADSITLTNNLVTNATNEDWGAVGIGLGYTRNSTVSHNEIENVNYSGISMGWGWSPRPNVMRNNKVLANKIHHFGKQNYDCAGIYTLSAQPGSLISENYIDSIYKAPYAHLPSHWFYLYTDEGSSQITIKDNWTATQKYLQNNNGPGNQWVNNGPQVNEAIRLKAGLQDDYKHLLKESTYKTITLPVNSEHEELVELVVTKGRLNLVQLRNFLSENKLDPNSIYKWNNRYVIFDKVQDLSVFQGKLKKAFPDVTVRPYYDMYYQFDPSRCDDKATAKEWEHVLLTANLVADSKKQKEYLNYHATQFEQWPEIAKGFCNAGFQRLVMFRNGRQLMLVISIPKGKTLDELNPKTTENNPRVGEWNKLMAQYQEGIEGTKKGEVWVFLKKVVGK